MPEAESRQQEEQEVECRGCRLRFVPDFINDYYDADENGQNGLCERCMMRKALTPPDPVMPPSESHLKEVCRFKGGEKTCRFLAMNGPDLVCAKGSSLDSTIRRRDDMLSKGDNCSGPPDFTPIK